MIVTAFVRERTDEGTKKLTYCGDAGFHSSPTCTTSITSVATAIYDVYKSLRDTGLTGVSEEEIARQRARVGELISLPEYYQVEAETAEKAYQGRWDAH